LIEFGKTTSSIIASGKIRINPQILGSFFVALIKEYMGIGIELS